jgi:hypothetical protein
MLTPEEKQRIEEEERKRHAEEQYRAQVRSQLQQPTAAIAPPQQSPAKSWSSLKILAGVAACVVSVVIVANLASNSARKATASGGTPSPLFAPQPHYVPMTTSIASGQVVVRHGSAVNYPITITTEMRNPVVSGTFTAAGGQGNDIAAVLADESGYTNWVNGHQAQVYWSTQGKETTGSFEVRLKPGTYYLALSNRFSAFTDKYVVLEASLKYQQLQTN